MQLRVFLTVTEADLGMCGLCGRTGAPTKRGPPHEDKHKFLLLALNWSSSQQWVFVTYTIFITKSFLKHDSHACLTTD